MFLRWHRTELQAVKDQLGSMVGLISNFKNARQGIADTSHKLRSINVAMESLQKMLVRPGAQLRLNDARIGYCLCEMDTVIAGLEKGRKKLESYSGKHRLA